MAVMAGKVGEEPLVLEHVWICFVKPRLALGRISLFLPSTQKYVAIRAESVLQRGYAIFDAFDMACDDRLGFMVGKSLVVRILQGILEFSTAEMLLAVRTLVWRRAVWRK